MYSKFAIFAAISLSLVTVGYGSSISEVCAQADSGSVTGCEYQNPEKTHIKCCYFTEPKDADDIFTLYCTECIQGTDGDWSCIAAPAKGAPEALPEGLQDELDLAIGESQNTTKVPETGVLDEPDALSDDEDESTENGDDDTEVPKRPGGLNNDDDAPTINPGLP
jgi:hypothetical protein